jgi:outer membrane protein OmpA-like peptidoglycan-associated protein
MALPTNLAYRPDVLRLTAIAALALLAAPAAALSPFVVFFDSGSAALDSQARAVLDNAAAQIRFTEVREILIEGAADRVGSAAANLRLSRRRVETVRAYLVARGVPAAVIRTQAQGETGRPLIETADGVGEPQNRYAAVIVTRSCIHPPARSDGRMPGC